MMMLRLLYQAKQHQDERTVHLIPELQAARNELLLAWRQFDQAESGYIDAAIYRLIAAERVYGALLAEHRGVVPPREPHIGFNCQGEPRIHAVETTMKGMTNL